ncbi:MAG: WG repeat-containing protein [Flavobacteriaceae bacterium]|nr:WG repeat-containing protein [Flavobacteriaceae bacterium]
MKPCFLFLTLVVLSCNTQHSVITNEIIKTNDYLFGVTSQNGNLLIDSIYGEIRVLYDNARQTLPPTTKRQPPEPLEYYVVSNTSGQKAIFDSNGKLIFDFIDCFEIQFDQHTQTVVTTTKLNDNRMRSSLFNLRGQMLFDTTFEHIYFINDSDLIALIVEEGSNDEFYLYNPFTKQKLGPFNHFNIFNGDSSPLLGMNQLEFEKYKALNLITVRTTIDYDYRWGIIDMKGNEVLPVEYDYFRIIDNEMKTRYIEKAEKPDDVDFIFYSRHYADKSTVLFLDFQINIYVFLRSTDNAGTIKRVE